MTGLVMEIGVLTGAGMRFDYCGFLCRYDDVSLFPKELLKGYVLNFRPILHRNFF